MNTARRAHRPGSSALVAASPAGEVHVEICVFQAAIVRGALYSSPVAQTSAVRFAAITKRSAARDVRPFTISTATHVLMGTGPLRPQIATSALSGIVTSASQSEGCMLVTPTANCG